MNNLPRYECHCHSMFSNFRLLDAISKPEDIISRAIKLGLSGICLTDHETVAGIPKFFSAAEKYPDFKVAAGNEIYLCKDREPNQKYYHFILNAKNFEGWKALKELSSKAWMNSFFDRGMERVVTTYEDLKKIVNKYPNSLIATTACLGGELSTQVKKLIKAEQHNDEQSRIESHNQIVNFITWCKEIFKDDFYIECAPGCSRDQILVNQRLVSIAQCFKIKMVIGTDAHYLKKEDRYIHKSYLNSKGGEREVDDFYEYSYLQTTEEIFNNLRKSNFDDLFIKELFNNSLEICDKIEKYSIWHNQTIPKIEVKDYPKKEFLNDYPHLHNMYKSDDIIERYWVNQCVDKLNEIDKFNETYLSRLEEEATTKTIIGNKLGTNIFAYPIVLQHYINMFWECGSTVGAGRGSSCAGLNHFLLNVTQINPVEWNFPWFRYLNEERIELPDIDIDLAPSKRPMILQQIKNERGKRFNSDIDELSRKNLGCTLIATYGTETSKSAIQTACRGYRSEEYPDGIDNDISQYLSSLVPVERGFVWSLHEVYYGNEEKGRKPITTFINEVNKYPSLLDIMFGIEGLVKQRGSHASGVIMNDEDPYEFLAYMKTPSGDIITQFDLHDCERMGATKYDFLVTEVQDKITECIRLLQKDNVIDSNLSLKEVYNKYLHPSILPIDDEKTWSVIQQASSLDLFQLDSDIGRQGAKKIKPTNIEELSAVNGLIRLMTSEKGAETPMEKYIRFRRNPKEWDKEMNNYNLTEEEKKSVRKHISRTYGIGISQEQLMTSLMDPGICGFSLKEANNARKTVAKKQMSKIADLRKLVFEKAVSKNMAEYMDGCGSSGSRVKEERLPSHTFSTNQWGI